MIRDVVEAYEALSKRELRLLRILEVGHRRFEYVPQRVVERWARGKREDVVEILRKLHRLGLLRRNLSPYLGWKITAAGYDVLALHTLRTRRKVASISPTPLGVGKEAVVYAGETPSGFKVAVKFYRRGVSSFRYEEAFRSIVGRFKHLGELYDVRLSALAEYFALSKIFDGGGLVPEPITYNRHVVVMAYVDGVELYRLTSGDFKKVADDIIETLRISLSLGIIHGDLSPYNIIVGRRSYVIDWPQWVPSTHPKAALYLKRDLYNLETFFRERGVEVDLGGLYASLGRGAEAEFIDHINKYMFL